MCAGLQFGLIVVGDELLVGKRIDGHMPHVIDTLHARGMQLAWSRFVSDDRRRLIIELKSTQHDSIPVFCFGGIGATPDDQTRQAAAEAFGTTLTRHPDAVAMIEERFGDEAYPNRILMADLPENCLLIPNPYNQVPGFTLYDHHFFPGFPIMAWPMLEWVLDHYYPARSPQHVEKSVRVLAVRESELIQLMNALSQRHPNAKLYSLPHLSETNSIEIGFRGEPGAVEDALADLVDALRQRALPFSTSECGMESGALTDAGF